MPKPVQTVPEVFMSERQQDQNKIRAFPQQDPSISIPLPHVRFRLTADFVVEVPRPEIYVRKPEVTPEERRLLLTILTSPKALNRLCRLAIVDDLAGDDASLFEGQFAGAENEEILSAVMPYLSHEDQTFWTRLQQEDPPVNPLTEIFCEFKTALQRVVVEDVETGEAIPLQGQRYQVS